MAWTPPLARFRGHRGAVHALLCDDALHAHVLVSGGADGSCRLWDVRTTRATKCINVARALGLSARDAADDAAVNALAFGAAPYLYLSAGSKILTFDLRQDALVLDCAAKELFADGDEEINALAVHPSKRRFLSAADDNGDVRVYDLERHRLHKTLRGQHANLCMAAPFRPQAPWDLVSGALDGRLLFWDFSRGRMKFCLDMHAGVGSFAASDTASQLFNPPLVHGVAFAANGKSLAAALGDGRVAVVDFQSKQVVRKLKNHAAAVCQVHFPAFRRDEWLLACGNDAKVSVFDYAGALAGDGEGGDEDGAFVVKDFRVEHKPNAMAASLHQSVVHVADTSNVIASYPLL